MSGMLFIFSAIVLVCFPVTAIAGTYQPTDKLLILWSGGTEYDGVENIAPTHILSSTPKTGVKTLAKLNCIYADTSLAKAQGWKPMLTKAGAPAIEGDAFYVSLYDEEHNHWLVEQARQAVNRGCDGVWLDIIRTGGGDDTDYSELTKDAFKIYCQEKGLAYTDPATLDKSKVLYWDWKYFQAKKVARIAGDIKRGCGGEVAAYLWSPGIYTQINVSQWPKLFAEEGIDSINVGLYRYKQTLENMGRDSEICRGVALKYGLPLVPLLRGVLPDGLALISGVPRTEYNLLQEIIDCSSRNGAGVGFFHIGSYNNFPGFWEKVKMFREISRAWERIPGIYVLYPDLQAYKAWALGDDANLKNIILSNSAGAWHSPFISILRSLRMMQVPFTPVPEPDLRFSPMIVNLNPYTQELEDYIKGGGKLFITNQALAVNDVGVREQNYNNYAYQTAGLKYNVLSWSNSESAIKNLSFAGLASEIPLKVAKSARFNIEGEQNVLARYPDASPAVVSFSSHTFFGPAVLQSLAADGGWDKDLADFTKETIESMLGSRYPVVGNCVELPHGPARSVTIDVIHLREKTSNKMVIVVVNLLDTEAQGQLFLRWATPVEFYNFDTGSWVKISDFDGEKTFLPELPPCGFVILREQEAANRDGENGVQGEKIIVYPNPYVGGRSEGKKINFTNLPSGAVLKIYAITGELVKTMEHNDGANGTESWDISAVSSGVYLYLVTSTAGTIKGKVSVIK